MALLNVTAFDRQYYEEKLKIFLPKTFIDYYASIWLEKFLGKVDVEKIFYSNSARIFGL